MHGQRHLCRRGDRAIHVYTGSPSGLNSNSREPDSPGGPVGCMDRAASKPAELPVLRMVPAQPPTATWPWRGRGPAPSPGVPCSLPSCTLSGRPHRGTKSSSCRCSSRAMQPPINEKRHGGSFVCRLPYGHSGREQGRPWEVPAPASSGPRCRLHGHFLFV